MSFYFTRQKKLKWHFVDPLPLEWGRIIWMALTIVNVATVALFDHNVYGTGENITNTKLYFSHVPLKLWKHTHWKVSSFSCAHYVPFLVQLCRIAMYDVELFPKFQITFFKFCIFTVRKKYCVILLRWNLFSSNSCNVQHCGAFTHKTDPPKKWVLFLFFYFSSFFRLQL